MVCDDSRFTEHKTDLGEIPTERPILIPCRQPGCRCVSFDYVANASGTSDPNCRCKHSLDNHATKPPYKCQKSMRLARFERRQCRRIQLWLDCNCTGFSAPFTCTCGESANKHTTLVETKAEREQRGHPTGYATPYQAMGGLTGFSSLAEGYLRLDPSGRGSSNGVLSIDMCFSVLSDRTTEWWVSWSTDHSHGSSDSSGTRQSRS